MLVGAQRQGKGKRESWPGYTMFLISPDCHFDDEKEGKGEARGDRGRNPDYAIHAFLLRVPE